jgi:hypothetical protein
MSGPRYHGKAAFDAGVVTKIATALQMQWDPDGLLLHAAAHAQSDDHTLARTYHDFALAIAGLLAAGGSEAEVSGYLRREEERLLGEARSTGAIRWPLARLAWRAVRGIDLPPGQEVPRT